MINPELTRNFWIELKSSRLISTAIIIGLISWFAYLIGSSRTATNTNYYIAIYFIFFWGTSSSASCVLNEYTKNTWDWQRLSGMSPWSLTWGKLFGSTSFAWLAAIYCISYALLFNQFNTVNADPYLQHKIFSLILTGVFAHNLALLESLEALNTGSTRSYLFSVVTTIIISILIMSSLSETLDRPSQIAWYSTQYEAYSFLNTSLILFLGWSLIGNYRLMRQQLQYKCTPWIFALFNLFIIAYCDGFIPANPFDPVNEATSFQLFNIPSTTLSFTLVGLLTFYSLLTERIDLMLYKKIKVEREKNGLMAMMRHSPKWIVSYSLFVLLGLWLIFKSTDVLPKNIPENTFSSSVFILGILLFFTRDMLIIHYLKLQSSAKNVIGTLLIYLFILYAVLPMILKLLGLASVSNSLFWPNVTGNLVAGILSPILQIGIMAYLLHSKIGRLGGTRVKEA